MTQSCCVALKSVRAKRELYIPFKFLDYFVIKILEGLLLLSFVVLPNTGFSSLSSLSTTFFRCIVCRKP